MITRIENARLVVLSVQLNYILILEFEACKTITFVFTSVIILSQTVKTFNNSYHMCSLALKSQIYILKNLVLCADSDFMPV